MKVCCILNDRSGSTASFKRYDFTDLFARRRIKVELFISRPGISIAELAKTAVRRNYDIIVAGGGDGTISSVASALMGHPTIRLGILPLGTLNHFAQDLNIPLDISQAVDVICDGYSEAIDVGSVNDRYFVNNSSLGLYPAVVRLRESLQTTGYSKWWAAALSSLRILSRFRRLDLEVQDSRGSVVKHKTPLLFVGNNAYQTTAGKLGTRLSIKRGRLWITIPVTSTRAGLFLALARLVFGRERPADTVILETTNLKVISKKRMLTVANDGEVLHFNPPLIYRILPQALNVIVPLPKKKA